MNLVIIKYNAGNIRSVLYALERIGAEALVTDDHSLIRQADKVLFPGVGEASTAMRYLKERKMDKLISDLKQPVLGICLGMQLMCSYSEENDTACLGIFNTRVRRFDPADGLKIPQIGWNRVEKASGALFKGIVDEPFCYFVHSYYAECCAETTATTNYGKTFGSAMGKGNFYGVQFHPEKSAAAGEQILKNFIQL
jgi:imidazole glycerol-phosphate synthase subunit HisH